jgi:hypothetical protein
MCGSARSATLALWSKEIARRCRGTFVWADDVCPFRPFVGEELQAQR